MLIMLAVESAEIELRIGASFFECPLSKRVRKTIINALSGILNSFGKKSCCGGEDHLRD